MLICLADFIELEVTCNTGTHALPDMYAISGIVYISGNALLPVLHVYAHICPYG